MSLINKMLRDLDTRRAGDGNRAALPAAVTPLAARREPRRTPSRLWLGLVLAALILGAAAWYATQVRTPQASAATPVAAPPAAPATKVVVAPETIAPARDATATTDAALPTLRLADELSVTPVPAAEPPRKATTTESKGAERSVAGAITGRPPLAALPAIPTATTEARIDKQVRLSSPAERAEIEYRHGVQTQRQGDAEKAAGSYRAALADFAEHAAARQTLAALLIEAKRFDEAEELLRKGTELAPVRLASTLALARLKVERNQMPAALELLQKNAASGERSAEYQGFTGALLNRAGRAAEAVDHYHAATRLAPSEGRWWAGLGIALEAAGRSSEAREAYLKARTLPGLPADLAQHIEHRLR